MWRWIFRSAVVGLVFYTIIRAAVVWQTFTTYGVNPWVFLAIDVATVYPYAEGIKRLIQGLVQDQSVLGATAWGTIAVASFTAPYAYMYAVGGTQMPLIVHCMVGAVLVLLAANTVRGVLSKYRAALRARDTQS